MTRRWLMLVMAGAAILLAACGGTDAGAGGPSSAEIELGEEIFRTGGATRVPCATCHTLDGTDLVGPSLEGISGRAAERTELSAEAYLHQSIVEPGVHIVEGYDNVMNSNYDDLLSAEEIDALVAYLLTQ